MSFENQDELMRQCVDLYYNRGLSQTEIAKKTYISRSSVCRLLKLARDKNIVRITIDNTKISKCVQLEKIYKEMFGLNEAIIVLDNNQNSITKQVSDASAFYIDGFVKGDTVIAISRGNSMKNLVRAIEPKRNVSVKVVQLIGLMNNPEKNDDEMDIAKVFANAYGGDYYNLYSPFVIEDEKVKQIFNKYAAVEKTLKMAEKANVVITSIGAYSVDDKHIISNSYLSNKEKNELIEKGAVGLICGNYFDINGKLIKTSIDKDIIGLDFNKIIEKEVIGIAYGKDKIKPILGALRGGFLNTLITDQITALNVLIQNGVHIKNV